MGQDPPGEGGVCKDIQDSGDFVGFFLVSFFTRLGCNECNQECQNLEPEVQVSFEACNMRMTVAHVEEEEGDLLAAP